MGISNIGTHKRVRLHISRESQQDNLKAQLVAAKTVEDGLRHSLDVFVLYSRGASNLLSTGKRRQLSCLT